MTSLFKSFFKREHRHQSAAVFIYFFSHRPRRRFLQFSPSHIGGGLGCFFIVIILLRIEVMSGRRVVDYSIVTRGMLADHGKASRDHLGCVPNGNQATKIPVQHLVFKDSISYGNGHRYIAILTSDVPGGMLTNH